jgi:hypothetical protein
MHTLHILAVCFLLLIYLKTDQKETRSLNNDYKIVLLNFKKKWREGVK